MSTKTCVLFLLLLLAPGTYVRGQAQDTDRPPATHIAVPKTGISFWTVAGQTINAKKANIGDAVKLKLLSDLQVGEMIIPKSAVLIAEIRELRRPDEADGHTKIGIFLQRAEWDGSTAEFNARIAEAYYPGEKQPIGGFSDLQAFRVGKEREQGTGRVRYEGSIGYDMPAELIGKMGVGAFPAPIEDSKSGGGKLIILDDKDAMKRGWPSGRIVEGTCLRFQSDASAKGQK